MSIDGFEDVPANDEKALQKAVSQQPVSVAICASANLQFYSALPSQLRMALQLWAGLLASALLTCFNDTVPAMQQAKASLMIAARTSTSAWSCLRHRNEI